VLRVVKTCSIDSEGTTCIVKRYNSSDTAITFCETRENTECSFNENCYVSPLLRTLHSESFYTASRFIRNLTETVRFFPWKRGFPTAFCRYLLFLNFQTFPLRCA
jgi:hypothetical protein